MYINSEITYGPDSAIGDGKFIINYNGENIVLDYSDHLTVMDRLDRYPYYFKFHYSEGVHEHLRNVFSFSPISFYDWEQFKEHSKIIRYTCSSDRIISRQHPHGNAFHRRTQVQQLLKKIYGKNAVFPLTDQDSFWKDINDCLVSVCVPGSRNNMLDRGQFQYMAYGACTISPYIITILPYFQKLIPGVHYICCADDYSDLIDKIEWCRNNRLTCIEIGENAKKLFMNTSTPEKLWTWVNVIIANGKN